MSKLIPVTKEISDYTDDELEQFYEEFAPPIERYRRRRRYFMRVFIPVFFALMIDIVIVAVGSLLSWQERPVSMVVWFLLYTTCFLFLLLFACAFYGVFLSSFIRRVECPACHNRLDFCEVGDYCPDCGSNQIEGDNRLKYPQCNACGKKLFRCGKGGIGRSYKIRYCTNCGVFLDEEGF
jgi:hypothetical protein